MKKRLSLFLLIPFLCFSCSKGQIRYGVSPYIEISTSEKGEIVTLLPSEVKEKMDNKESFPLLLQKTGCDYCSIAKENYINPFLENNPIIIYSINSSEIIGIDNEKEIYEQIVEPFKNINSEGYRVVPHLAVIHEGNYVNGESYMEFYTLLIESYFIY